MLRDHYEGRRTGVRGLHSPGRFRHGHFSESLLFGHLAFNDSIALVNRYYCGVGSFYTNVTLRGPDGEQVIAAIRELGYRAFVADTINGLTLICEQQSDTQDKGIWHTVASRLSEKLACAALAVMNHDDDFLLYGLYQSGRLVDEYNSCPAYWNEVEQAEPLGGDPKMLCQAFGMPGNHVDIDRVLHTPTSSLEDDGEDEFVFATERHAALISALDWPDVPYQQGFDYLTKERLDSRWHVVG